MHGQFHIDASDMAMHFPSEHLVCNDSVKIRPGSPVSILKRKKQLPSAVAAGGDEQVTLMVGWRLTTCSENQINDFQWSSMSQSMKKGAIYGLMVFHHHGTTIFTQEGKMSKEEK